MLVVRALYTFENTKLVMPLSGGERNVSGMEKTGSFSLLSHIRAYLPTVGNLIYPFIYKITFTRRITIDDINLSKTNASPKHDEIVVVPE